jgi:hypothetical protein
MKELSCRFEMLISPEQNQEWTALAKERNLTKAELVRRTMAKSDLKRQRTQKDLKIYQQLGQLTEELKKKKIDCFNTNPVKMINEIIRSIEQLRLEVIRKEEK